VHPSVFANMLYKDSLWSRGVKWGQWRSKGFRGANMVKSVVRGYNEG
jgi:hypothetical protein